MNPVANIEDSDSDVTRLTADFERLLADARAGDELAFETLLKHFVPGIHIITQERLDSDIRTQVSLSDLAQTTLLEIHQALHQFQGHSPQEFAAWIEAITVNNVLNEYRYWSRQRRAGARSTRSLNSDILRDVADDTLTPRRRTSRKEQQQKVEQALQELPHEYQQVILLRNRQGLSFAEIGSELGRTTDAARMLWARALERLAAKLKQEPQ